MRHRLDRFMLRCLCLACALYSGYAPQAVADRLTFHNIFNPNSRTGLELSGINHIAQDQQGFIWFGGEKGLARYNGRDIKLYLHDPLDPKSLSHSHIRGLLVDRQGLLWAATQRGLCAYLPKLDSFDCVQQYAEQTLPKEPVRSLALDGQDNLYVGTVSGLFRISSDRRNAAHFPLSPPGTKAGAAVTVTAIEAESDSTLWLGTEANGLVRFDPETEEARYIQAQPGGLVHNKIQALALDQQNQLWVATYGGGVSVYNAERSQFTNHAFQAGEPGTLSSNVIWDVFSDSFGNVWLAVDQGGLVRFDERRGFVASRHKPFDATSLVADQVRTIYEDRNSDLWIGTFPSGVSFYNRSTGHIENFKHEPGDASSLSHSAILSVHRDQDNNIWIGTEDGLNLFAPERGTFLRYQLRGTNLAAKAILSIEQFDQNTLWVGTWSGGLMAFDLRERSFRPINTAPADGSGSNSLFIWDITRDRNGNMWLGSEFDGAIFYDRRADAFLYHSHNPDDDSSLPNNFVWSIIEDRSGTVWIATTGGLAVMRAGDPAPHRVYRDPKAATGLQSDRIIAVYEDRRGRIWLGSQDNGAFVLDPATGHYQHFGLQQAMPSTTVAGFIEDSDGNVWMMTTSGLVRAMADNFRLLVLSSVNGLVGNNFNRNAALIGKDGQLFFGGADGLSTFHPKDLVTQMPEFPVWITELRIMNKPVVVGAEGSPLSQSMLFTSTLEINHQDLMVAFDFAALNYRSYFDTRYAYKLDGFDSDWNYIGANSTATYTNIRPGNYLFRAKASHGGHGWIESPSLRVRVKPAPWQSRWAYGGYGVGLVLLGYLLANYLKLRVSTRLYRALSSTDVLTGVANRVGLSQAAAVLFSSENRQPLCVIFIDVDHFKSINDRRGHDSGDRVLAEVAHVLRQSLRQTDVVGRWGGEEFLVICSGADQAAGCSLAEKIRQRVAEHIFDQHDSPLKVSVSLGVACAQSGEAFEAVCKRADQALYKAKQSGRNRVVEAC